MVKNYLLPLDRNNRNQQIGNKAANLQRLQKLGMRIPVTHVLTWEAYERYVKDDVAIIEQVANEIDKKLKPGAEYAVRSSASNEDHFEHSFAGQFKSVLSVKGRDSLLQAIWAVWAMAKSPAVEKYLQKMALSAGQFHMAVILQEMVAPVFSGVSFSRNPTSGARETVVEAVRGPGTGLVQEGITPWRWISLSGEFRLQPDECELSISVINEVVEGTRKLAQRLKKDIDLEWVFDGKDLYWVQMREITTLREIQVYSNQISREMVAGLIKPLIWSINIPMVNGAWINMLTEVIGPNQLTPEKLACSFYYRTYFNMGLLGEIFESLGIPGESLEMMWGISEKGNRKFKFRPTPQMLRLLPRIVRFLRHKWSLSRHLDARLPELESAFRSFQLEQVDQLSVAELLEEINRLYPLVQEAAYYNIVLPLSMYIYNAILRREMNKIGVDYTRLDMQQDTAEFKRFTPVDLLERLKRKFYSLEPDLQKEIRGKNYAQVIAHPGLGGFRDDLQELMTRFGHLCDNGNDFSTKPWRESGDTILNLIMNYQNSRQTLLDDGRVEKISIGSISLPLWKRWMVRRLYYQTRQFNLYREHISYIYSYGYGLFRPYFLAIGNLFTRSGLIDAPEDIFYLDWPQICQIANDQTCPVDLRQQVSKHKEAIERVKDAQLPTLIYGDQEPPLEGAAAGKLTGTPTSRGYCTGRVKVMMGLQDFHKVEDGDILVIPYSDVGWTPLFARVAGVIAESGGMLSHSSIVAREYGIPAIVSVSGATSMKDGTRVRIDGYRGEVTILEEESIGEKSLSQEIDRESHREDEIANP